MYTHLKRLLWVIKQDGELALLYVDDYGPKKNYINTTSRLHENCNEMVAHQEDAHSLYKL